MIKKKMSAPEVIYHERTLSSQPELKKEEQSGLRIGDFAKLTVVGLTLGFLALLVSHDFGLELFGKSYLENGFCISNLDKSVTVQSHAISFYADAAMALVMGLIVKAGYRANMTERSLRPIHMEAVLVDIPILLMTYTEAITCDSFLIHYGGHVWFDMAVPFGFIAYYVILLFSPEIEDEEAEDRKNQ